MTLSTKILIGLALGILCGIFFGEAIAFVGIVGKVFVLLLQMTVLPYVTVSLVMGLGSLSYEQAGSLGRKAGVFLLVSWAAALTMVLLLPLSFPGWKSGSFFSSNLVEAGKGLDFLSLYIPANPFRSLSDNAVPAVVLFSIALGIALIGIERKRILLDVLSVLSDTLTRITGFVVRLSPIGVFAIAAHAAGTMDPGQFKRLQVYVAAYAGAALLLTFWLLPVLVTTLTPFRYRDVVHSMRAALVTAFATGNVFIVLPLIAERCKELLRPDPETPSESDHVVEVVVPASFNFPSAGKLLTLSFVPFAGWLSGFSLSAAQYPSLLATGTLSFFGSTLVAVPFLLDLFRIPSDTFQLFLVADSVVGNRFGAMLAAMHTVVLGLLGACAVAGSVAVRWRSLLRYVGISAVLIFAVFGGIRLAFEAMGHRYEKYQLFVERPLLFEPAPARILETPPEPPSTAGGSASTLDRVRRRGSLRVGFLRDSLPYTFFNDAGNLVGFDVDMMHVLARELGVTLEFVRIDIDRAIPLLDSRSLDIVIGGIAVTTELMERVSFSASYIDETIAFVVEDHRRDEFNSRDALLAHRSLRIAVPPAPYYAEKLHHYVPQAEVTIVDSVRPFFRGELDVDALLLTAETGSSWCLIYPNYTVAVPQPDILKVPLAYPVARGDRDTVAYLDGWIDLKRKDGTIASLFDYWVRGVSTGRKKPRWSVMRNVLGWGD